MDRRRRFEEVAAEVYEPLQRYLRRRASNEDADDALGDVMLILWRRLDDVPAGAALPWSYAVARNVLANTRRAQRRRIALVERVAQVDPGPHLADMAEDGHPEVMAALMRLPETDREVLALWAWEELEPREIAVALDSTPNAISLRLSRARSRLAAELARQAAVDAGHEGTERAGEHPG
jgi:RNA polymerase sigma-70 factor (ECF subfamily)